jgi:hypothetical protein
MTEPVEPRTSDAAETAAVTVEKKKKKKKRKKKMRYSWGLGLAQQYLRAFNKAGRSVAEAAGEYWGEWDERWDRSARRRKDGALRDLPRNQGRAISRGMRAAADGPKRFTAALPRIGKLSLLRLFFPPLWFRR